MKFVLANSATFYLEMALMEAKHLHGLLQIEAPESIECEVAKRNMESIERYIQVIDRITYDKSEVVA